MSLSPGGTLSHFRLVAPLGQGGMGVVWRATDSTLGRDVALKILPDVFAGDPERLARFEREAKLLASLNDPHIAAIYGLHAADGVRFLAMEYVEGEDLARRLERGPIPLAEALPLALQIARALEHAHERGIVHRDLKPANILLTQGGAVKVLDFGLARALETAPGVPPASGSALSQSPTITGNLTGADVLLGTAAYMAPEQARGQPADKRADIWAFGVVVYEMLTGTRLFEGETISDTLAAVLRGDPDWSALPPDTPPRLRDLLRRCLERKPAQRLRDIGEARIALEEILAGKPEAIAAAVGPAAPARRGPPWWAGALAVALVAVGLVVGLGALRRTPAVPLRKFQLTLPPGNTSLPRWPAISPDAGAVAYVLGGTLMVQSLGELEPRTLKTDGDASYPFWSPDGKFIGYASGSRLMKVALEGGESQAICDLRGDLQGGTGFFWDGRGIITFSRADQGGLFQVPANGGDPKPWIAPDSGQSDLHEPFVLPGGRGVIFAAHRIQTGIDNLTLFSGGRRKVLLEVPQQVVGNPVYDPAGFVLFSRMPTTRGIWALPFSLRLLRATGPPFLVAPGGSNPSISSDGTLTYLSSGLAASRQLAWWSREGKEEGRVGQPENDMGSPALSPDGRRIAVAFVTGSNRDIWLLDPTRGGRTRLTFDPGSDDGPCWTPDGKRIVYTTLPIGAAPPGGFRIVVRNADGTGRVDTLARGLGPGVTPDGKHVLYVGFDGMTRWDQMEVPLDPPGSPRVAIRGNPLVLLGRVSPAGDLLAYMSNESGQWEVYLTRYPSCEGRWQVSTAGGQWPRWNGKGDRLFFGQGEDIMEVAVGAGPTPTLGTPVRLFTRPALGPIQFGIYSGFDVTPDGRRIVVLRSASEQGPTQSVTVVQNWKAEFAGRK